MRSSQHSRALNQRPSGFTTIREVLDEGCKLGSFINIAGVVINIRAPRATNGADWKCTLHLIDQTVDESDSESLTCHFFMPKDHLPDAGCGDVLILHTVKLQQRFGDLSLLSNRQTKFSVLSAAKIPQPPTNAAAALSPVTPARQRTPSLAELQYVSSFYHSMSKHHIPTVEEYRTSKVQSLNVKEKFKELKDVQEGFCDLIAQITRVPHDSGDKMTLWISDYTENPAFYNFVIGSVDTAGCQAGDPYGYVDKFKKKADMGGPYGKRSMQVTCWEPHASVIRDEKLSKGTWVSMKNVQIKYGSNGTNLEGFLREDRQAYGVKLGISALDSTDREAMDLRHYAAIKRHRDYEQARKSQLKEVEEAAQAGQKRKSLANPDGKNANARRNQKRRLKQEEYKRNASENAGNAIAGHVPTAPTPQLNSSVKCENPNVLPSKVSDVLERVIVQSDIDGNPVPLVLPFVNMNHRMDVRVTDYRPSSLQDFAYPKKQTQFDVLSDDGEIDDDSESGNDEGDDIMPRSWEWRFALELEDATPDATDRQRFWVVVDNPTGQYLTSLDATDLRSDHTNLDELRQKMFILWGDLEEQKTKREVQAAKDRRVMNDNCPPPDSSDAESDIAAKNTANAIANRPFSCCVQQYGIKVSESHPRKADAGPNRRWMRVFGLYGTRIIGG